MSPNNSQDSGLEPRPLFPAVEAPEETVEVTGLFDPRPQDVRPWDLFQRQDVVEEGLGLTPDEPAEAEPKELVDGLEGIDSALEADSEEDGSIDEGGPETTEATEGDLDEAPDTVTLSPEEMDAALDSEEQEGADNALEADGYSSTEEVAGLLDETMAEPEPAAEEPVVEEPVSCANCEAVEAQAEATLDATIEALQTPYLEGSEALQRAAQDVSKDFVQNLLRLSVELASTILRRTAALDPETVLASLDGALEIAGPLSEVTVRCHPEDAPLLREHGAARAEAITGRLVDIAVRPQDSMPRGACIVDFEDGLVDARWDVQLGRLADAISPALIHHAAEAASEIVAETITPPKAVDGRSDLAVLTEEVEADVTEAETVSVDADAEQAEQEQSAPVEQDLDALEVSQEDSE